ncbi:uncharacterized protein LOC114530577 [Dendronephthya gigantea]|uniref:uncharacterized protein LOC114530577 n=1 Tax=Dendronephthya gigantea TaxID=151771 RepID=UPI00106D2671|nr:uncharacterized protein LOC114530577 [Dendronephthya gigantea]
MTWTGEGGIFELIINGVLQSRMAGIEINGTISGQSRFIVGGSEIENRNLIGIIHNFNVWDKVLSDEMLHMMIAEPGNDMGNVVAWRDLKQPSSIPDKNFKVHDHTQNFRAQPIGRHNYGLIFEGSAPAYALTSYCCYSGQQMTISMWLKLKQLPVTLFTLIGAEPNPLMLLRIKSDGDITFYFDGKNARIANISLQSIGYWQNLALTWLSESGDVNTYLNGERHHVSSVFKGLYYPSRNKFMIGGDKNETMNGTVTQFSFWWKALPKPALMAMSRRIMGMNCLGVSWFRFTNTLRGDVTKIYSLGSYSADFIVQKKRDQSCNDNLPVSNCVSGKYRARYGVENNLGMMLGCFCEENLSQDMNFNNGPGDYSLHSTLVRIR